VQEYVGERLPSDVLPVDCDPVAGADDRVELARLTVDGDATGLDQLIGSPPRGDARAGEERVQAHA
jgi:hypothetical protein